MLILKIICVNWLYYVKFSFLGSKVILLNISYKREVLCLRGLSETFFLPALLHFQVLALCLLSL